MDKNIIKQYLNKTFIQESDGSGFPAEKLAKTILSKNKKSNTQGVEDIAKDMKDYEKDLTKPDPNQDQMATKQFNFSSEKDKTYHEEMEIMNGQEMIQYDDKPNEQFTQRAEEAIAGSARMGNSPEWANVVEKPWGGSPDFGKNLVKKIKASAKKRDEQTPSIRMQGRDIQADRKDYGNKPYALHNQNEEKATGNVIKDENKTKPQIKETMKRLKFKKEFNGVGNALKLIPEGYKEDKKIFEMTDGNESYRIRWEGTKDSGNAVVLKASDKALVNEDIQRMKALFNYKPEDTLGTVKGKDRLAEDVKFDEFYKVMTESEDIESTSPKEGFWSDIKPGQAPEAKKHKDGTVPEDAKTNAPAPAEGEWEEAVPDFAPEANKHREGTVKEDPKTNAPKPKEGEWDKIKLPGSQEPDKGQGGGIKKIEGVTPKEGNFDKAKVGYAPEANKHRDVSSAPKEAKTNAPKPKEGNPDDAVKYAPEASKDRTEKKS